MFNKKYNILILLFTFQAGWKENHATFINELKNLEATGLTNLGSAMKNAFDLLNVNRMQTGIDTYGQVLFLTPFTCIAW